MIKLTSINRIDTFWVNEDQIESLKETPDTILSMISGRKIPVAETAEEVVRIIESAREKPLIVYGGTDPDDMNEA
ncbi:MAG TPA: flagellar protein FlbD [Clostridiales bacterium]|nr:flagellar protein FlbD [Clostridiales bacterium]